MNRPALSLVDETFLGPVAVAKLGGTAEAERLWDTYIDSHPAATFFHKSGWRRLIETAHGHRCHFLEAVRDGRIVGVLPLVEVKTRLFGHSLISTAFTTGGGIVADDEAAKTALAETAAELGADSGVGYVELRGEAAEVEGWLDKEGVYATFRAAIAADEAENLKAIPRKKRADVRKSLKAELDVRAGIEPDAFYPVFAESYRNLGTPVASLTYFRLLTEVFGDAVEFSAIEQDGQALATLVSFYFKDTVLPYYGGASPAARPVHAYDRLYWSLMRRAVERGCTSFDFGRSKVGTGAFAYKTYWGFEPTPLTYQYRLVRDTEMPDINPMNPKYRLMVATWKKLPLWLANRIGPVLARQLG